MVDKEVRQRTRRGQSILERPFLAWLFPMAVPDQLAQQAVLLADERPMEVPVESDLVQGVGHELRP